TCRSCSRQNLSSPSTLKQPECWGLRCRNRSWPAPTRSSNEALEMRLTEEQRLLRDTARDVAQHLLMPHAAEWDRESRFPKEALTRAHVTDGATASEGATVQATPAQRANARAHNGRNHRVGTAEGAAAVGGRGQTLPPAGRKGSGDVAGQANNRRDNLLKKK